MSLSVTVKSASNLPNVERFSKSDPMCIITYQGRLCMVNRPLCFLPNFCYSDTVLQSFLIVEFIFEVH